MVAGTLTESNVIGAVGGIDTIPAVVSYIGGYVNGAKSVNPDVEVLVSYVSDDITKAFNDPTTGASIADQMIGQDADFIFQVAGLSGQGALEAACDAGISGIGVDTDQALALPDLTCIVTSAEKKLVDAVSEAIQRVADGSDEGGTILLDAASDPPKVGVLAVPQRSRPADAGAAERHRRRHRRDGRRQRSTRAQARASADRRSSKTDNRSMRTTRGAGLHRARPSSYPGTNGVTNRGRPVPRIEMRGITKRYPGVLANDHIDLDVRPGEIHALLGENGAGKSTLMNILYGLADPDEGEILMDGQPVTIKSPSDAIDRGISMVHQHFMLVPVLTVAENILLGDEPMANPIFLDRRDAHDRIRKLGDQFGFEVDPDAKVGSLSVGWQQRVEILKALYRSATILVLDEPTAVLTPQETREIFAVLRQLTSDLGTSIIFISHKLYEVLEIADRITVIRRGKVVGTRIPSETNEEELAELMVGRDVQLTVDRGESTPAGVVLSVDSLKVADDRGREVVHGVSFDVRAGEVFGIAGVAGNGQDEVVEAIMGLAEDDVGQGDARRSGCHRRLTARPPRQRRRLRAGRPASVRPGPLLPDHR